jgi:two-component system probable response regulator PhcQ
VLMTDQRMPGEKGVWLLEKTRQLQPRIIRILATAYADMDAAIAAVNTARLQIRHQAVGPVQLEQTLKRGWSSSWSNASATSCCAKKCRCCTT